jgi:hypothetical protein
LGKSAAFIGPNPTVSQSILDVTTIVTANYDGTFIPSASVRTTVPPDEAAELSAVTRTDKDVPDALWSPPWAAVKGV